MIQRIISVKLKKEKTKLIKKIILKIFEESKIYIFGSRLNNKKRGWDIDIFIIPRNRNNLFSKKAKTEFLLENELFKPVAKILTK